MVQGRLEPHREALISQLRALTTHSYPVEVETVHFEVFAGIFDGFPVRAFFLDSGNTEFFVYEDGEARYPCPVDPGLIATSPLLLPSEEDQLFQQDPELDYCTVTAEAVIPWFAGCWEAAGGSSFPRSATIGIHDDGRVLDLRSGQWLS